MIEIELPTRLVGGTITKFPLGTSAVGSDTPLSGIVFGAVYKGFVLTAILKSILFAAVPTYKPFNENNALFRSTLLGSSTFLPLRVVLSLVFCFRFSFVVFFARILLVFAIFSIAFSIPSLSAPLV